jgi:hypothetical protein
MTLTDPREALADHSSFISYLVGLAGLGRIVHELAAAGGGPSDSRREADDFVNVLLGLASVGAAVEKLANPSALQQNSVTQPSAPITRWLR